MSVGSEQDAAGGVPVVFVHGEVAFGGGPTGIWPNVAGSTPTGVGASRVTRPWF